MQFLSSSMALATLGLAAGLGVQTATAAQFSIDFETATFNGTQTGLGFYQVEGLPTGKMIFDAALVTDPVRQIDFTYVQVERVTLIGAFVYDDRNIRPFLGGTLLAPPDPDVFGIQFNEIAGVGVFDDRYTLRFSFNTDNIDSFLNAATGDVFTVPVFAEEFARSGFGTTPLGVANTTLEITTLEGFTPIPLPGTAGALLAGMAVLGAVAARRTRTL